MKSWQDEYLRLMTRWEEPVVRFTGKAAESAAEYVPERPSWAFLDEVPGITEFVDNQLKFRRRVVDEQAAFVRKMMKAMHPVLVRLEPKDAVSKRARRQGPGVARPARPRHAPPRRRAPSRRVPRKARPAAKVTAVGRSTCDAA